MKCQDARKHLYPFLDDELDVPTNLDVLAHLNVCLTCAVEFEAERGFGESLLRSQAEVGLSKSARARIRTSFLQQVGEQRRFPLRIRLQRTRGIAAALLVTITLVFVALSVTSPSGLALSAAEIHESELEHHGDVRRWAVDPGTIEGYVRGRYETATLRFLERTAFDLIGGRDCSQLGKGAVQVGLQYEGRPVSLYIVSGDRFDLTEFEKRQRGTRTVYVCPASHCAVVAWRCGEVVYALTAPSELENVLLDSVPAAR